MADVTYTTSCVNLDPATRLCHLAGKSCPLSSGRESECPDGRYLAKVVCPPDEFHVLVDNAKRPAAGKFAVKRCRTIEIHHAAGVHITNLLTCDSPNSLLHATPLGPETINLTTPDDASLLWHAGRFIPA